MPLTGGDKMRALILFVVLMSGFAWQAIQAIITVLAIPMGIMILLITSVYIVLTGRENV